MYIILRPPVITQEDAERYTHICIDAFDKKDARAECSLLKRDMQIERSKTITSRYYW